MERSWRANVSAVIAVVGVLVGGLLQWRRNKETDQEERTRHAEELRGAARGIAEAFDGAASALRVARESHGSLRDWSNDDEALWTYVDRVRREATNELWTEIQRVSTSLKMLRGQQRQKRADPKEACDDFAQSFEDAAKHVRAAYDPRPGAA